jgi:iron(II)-dependent oxidoreductase
MRGLTGSDATADRATSVEALSGWVRDARRRTLQLAADLDDDQLLGPRLDIVNPLLWELGHVGWFQEFWVLRHAGGRSPMLANTDEWYDSMAVAHGVRWDLSLPDREQTVDYLQQVAEAVLDMLQQGLLTEQLAYFVKLSVFHEDMHAESFCYTRQTHGWSQPSPGISIYEGASVPESASLDRGDVMFAGGEFQLGANRQAVFVFDNEKWAHPVTVLPFRMSPRAVSQQQFAEFVDDGGYRRAEWWCDQGWQWRCRTAAHCPAYWERCGDGWMRRHFDQWIPLEPQAAMIHVNWYEANAWCRWAGRRLPSEAEWEFAAAATETGGKRHYPWGESAPGQADANLDWRWFRAADVAAFAAGDSPEGCRQLLGNVWEWTSDTFEPYPGFQTDPYEAYSRPWFGDRKVLRGGCWATTGRMIRNTWRNYYQPDRRDVFAGFRTCAVDS